MRKLSFLFFALSVLLTSGFPGIAVQAKGMGGSEYSGEETVEALMTPVTPVTMKPMSFAFMTPAIASKVTVTLPQAFPIEIPCPSGQCFGAHGRAEVETSALPGLSVLAHEIVTAHLHMIIIATAFLLILAVFRFGTGEHDFLRQKLSTVVLRV